VADGFHLWSERYDRELADVFAIQDEITEAIVEALKVRLVGVAGPSPVRRYTPNADTYQLYLKGRFCIAKGTQEGFAMGMRLLDQAINSEPNYPLPYVCQAMAYWLLAHFGFVRPTEGMPKSQAAALRALALDDTLAEAHTQLALTRFMYNWDWAGAEQEFRRALELDPKSAEAHHWYGVFLWAMTRFEDALPEVNKAVELDPLSLGINVDAAFPLISLGRCDEAIAHADKLITIEPSFWGGYRVRGLAKAAGEKPDEAIADLEKAVALGGGPFMMSPLGSILAKVGRVAEARRILEQLEHLARERYIPACFWITVYAGLGDREQLLAWWDRAIEERDSVIAYYKAVAQTWVPENADLPVLLKKIGL
jgi:serine/threonine-protein kinase